MSTHLPPVGEQVEIKRRVEAEHVFSRREASMGCTVSVCSCGLDSGATNAPRHLTRWEKSHRSALINGALLRAAREARS